MDEIIKKLQNIKLPEIETPRHKAYLKAKLLELDKESQKLRWFSITSKPVFIAFSGVVVLAIIFNFLIYPQLIEAEALKIAKTHPEIRQLIEKYHLKPQDIQIQHKKAYILFTSTSKKQTPLIQSQIALEKGIESIPGVLAIIDMQQKFVHSVKPIESKEIIPITSEEKKRIQDLIKKEDIVREILPSTITIEKVEPALPSKLELKRTKTGIKIVPPKKYEKKAQIYYRDDGKRWVVEVNFTKGKIEKIKILKGRK